MTVYMYILYMVMDDEMVEDETKTTIKIPTDLLDDFKHLAIDMKMTVTDLIVEAMRQYLKDVKKKWFHFTD